MFFRFSATALLLMGLISNPIPLMASQESSESYKVLANQKAGLNLLTVKDLMDKGDKAISDSDLDKAREFFDQARLLTRQLLDFYRDLNGSFRGIDARIPREMDTKGREAQKLLAQTNLRLAALFRKQNQPEVAVPLLVEVVRLMTPTRMEGQKAYQQLLELGFVQTPYAGMRKGI